MSSIAAELVDTPRFVGRREGPAERLAADKGLVLEADYLETTEHEAGREKTVVEALVGGERLRGLRVFLREPKGLSP